MPLVNCPDCGKSVSSVAVACPNCGYPLTPPQIERETIIQDVPPPVVERDTFPKWILVPIVIIGTLLIFMLAMLYRQGDDSQNLNVNVSARRASNDTTERTTARTDTEPNQIVVPPAAETNVTTVPPGTDSSVTTIPPATTTTPDRGVVTLEARVVDRTGGTRSVRDEKFYLLDKDLDSILRDADIQDETGQGLVNAFGLSVLYPDRYSEINKKALSEINKHVVYDTLSDSTGQAKISNVKPDRYYLFAITKTANGFAVWNSPVTITPGENKLNLSPPRLTEVPR